MKTVEDVANGGGPCDRYVSRSGIALASRLRTWRKSLIEPCTNRSLSNFVDRTRQLVYRYSTGYGTGTGYFMYCMMPYRYGW